MTSQRGFTTENRARRGALPRMIRKLSDMLRREGEG
jgi:hypothetical protein